MEQNKFPSATRVVIKALQALMKERMPFLQNVYDDFPAHNDKLAYPSASIFTKPIKHNKTEPYLIKVGKLIEDPEDPNFNKAPAQYCIGSYDFNFQIDFWCESKFQRHDIVEAFVRAMNDVSPTSGVNIKLTDYYDQWIHFEFDDPSYANDNEQSSQRGEWRVMVQVLGNVRCITEKLESLMQNIELQTETN